MDPLSAITRGNGVTGRVMTVLGPVEPERLGRTLVHEHLFVDLRHCSFTPPRPELASLADARVAEVDPGILRANSCAVRDNLVLDDAALAAAELERFSRAGGGAIVDVTPPDIGRSPERLRALAAASGVSIVMGCGHYCEIAHGEDVASRSEDELFEAIVAELDGRHPSGIRPGIIGEIGVNGEERGTRVRTGEMTATERRALRAAARASRATGAPMTVHLPSRASAVPATIAELRSVDAPLDRISLSHMDTVDDFAMHDEALDRGLWIQYDCFGMALRNDWYTDPGDERRIDWLNRHRRRDRLDRVLVSHDVWCKAQLASYGGGGYAHLLTNVAPRLLERGFGDGDVEQLLVRNPAEFLTWRSAGRTGPAPT
jgi:phosphotriesterase-related protein